MFPKVGWPWGGHEGVGKEDVYESLEGEDTVLRARHSELSSL